uniref:Uncharacterized protein n=1 Tax=Anguilla anguilla TaxID=7936 RepID=A0A0E9UU59_ANGAN
MHFFIPPSDRCLCVLYPECFVSPLKALFLCLSSSCPSSSSSCIPSL